MHENQDSSKYLISLRVIIPTLSKHSYQMGKTVFIGTISCLKISAAISDAALFTFVINNFCQYLPRHIHSCFIDFTI